MRIPLVVSIALLGACASSSVPVPQPAPTPSGAAAPATPAPGVAVRALDYREAAPRRATPGMYVDSAGKPAASSLTGHLSVAVPESVAGLWEAHRQYGKLPWKD